MRLSLAFAANYSGVTPREDSEYLELAFATGAASQRRQQSSESKGYINQSWRVYQARSRNE